MAASGVGSEKETSSPGSWPGLFCDGPRPDWHNTARNSADRAGTARTPRSSLRIRHVEWHDTTRSNGPCSSQHNPKISEQPGTARQHHTSPWSSWPSRRGEGDRCRGRRHRTPPPLVPLSAPQIGSRSALLCISTSVDLGLRRSRPETPLSEEGETTAVDDVVGRRLHLPPLSDSAVSAVGAHCPKLVMLSFAAHQRISKSEAPSLMARDGTGGGGRDRCHGRHHQLPSPPVTT